MIRPKWANPYPINVDAEMHFEAPHQSHEDAGGPSKPLDINAQLTGVHQGSSLLSGIVDVISAAAS
jgi:hypothetical protein